jgi:hypothetical protein
MSVFTCRDVRIRLYVPCGCREVTYGPYLNRGHCVTQFTLERLQAVIMDYEGRYFNATLLSDGWIAGI